MCIVASAELYSSKCFAVFQVKWSVYLSYCRALGLPFFLVILLLFGLFEATSVVSSLWLTDWTEDKTMQNSSLVNSTMFAYKRDLYLGVYGGFGVLQGERFVAFVDITLIINEVVKPIYICRQFVEPPKGTRQNN